MSTRRHEAPISTPGAGPRGSVLAALWVVPLVVGLLLPWPARAQEVPPIPSRAKVEKLQRDVQALAAERRFAEAALVQAEIAGIFQRELPSQPGWEGGALSYLAHLHLGQERHDLAASALVAAAPLFEAQYGPDSPHLVVAYDGARNALMMSGQEAPAFEFEEKALALLGRIADEAALDARLEESAGLWKQLSIDRALLLKKKQADLRVRRHGPSSVPAVVTLTEAGQLAQALARWDEAELLFRRAVAAVRSAEGATRFDRAVVVNNLAELLRARGDPVRALPLYGQSLSLVEPAARPEEGDEAEVTRGLDDVRATLFNNRGLARKAIGELALAEEDLSRALRIRRALGDEVGGTYPANNLGDLLREIGRTDEARPLLEGAVKTRTVHLGERSDETATATLNLALLESDVGNFARAEQLFATARAAYTALYGAEHPRTANALANEAWTRYRRGDAGGARPLLEAAASTLGNTVPPEHAFLAAARQNLVTLRWVTGDAAGAEKLAVENERVLRERLGAGSIDYVMASAALGEVEVSRGQTRRGLARIRSALGELSALVVPDHPWLAALRLNLALHEVAAGRWAAAKPLLVDATRVLAAAVTPSADAVIAAAWLAEAYGMTGELDAMQAAMVQMLDLAERHLRGVLLVGTDEERMGAVGPLRSFMHALTLGLVRGQLPAELQPLALETLLRWKGRSLEVSDLRMQEVRERLGPSAAGHLRTLQTVRAEAARLELALVREGGDDVAVRKARLVEARARAEAAEAEVFRLLGEGGVTLTPPRLVDVAKAIPERGLLVEWLRVEAPSGEDRYALYVLAPDQESWVADLGEAKPIDAAIERLRRAITRRSDDVEAASRDVTRRLFAGLHDGAHAKVLAEADHLFLSPDDVISLVPFAALRGQRAGWLVEEKTLTVLGSGRDLVRLSSPGPAPRGPPLVVASPSYGPAGEEALASFSPLPGTLPEGVKVRRLLGQADLLVGARATEAAVKERAGPAVLHLATHGFFLAGKPLPSSSNATQRGFLTLGGKKPIAVAVKLPRPPVGAAGGDTAAAAVVDEMGHAVRAAELDPLARSGLALAYANVRRSLESEDGILTALEAASLDLRGTELVVLSACQTGVGETRAGAGVLGLRRALSLAGARSHVMSLWSVDDEATRALMVSFYEHLGRGQGRSEALRSAQLELLAAGGPFAHPFAWAPFILSGDHRPLRSTTVGEVR